MGFYIFSFICTFIYTLLYYNIVGSGNDTYSISLVLFFLNLLFFYIAGKKREYSLYTFWTRPSYILILCLIVVNLQNIVNVIFEIAPISFYLRTNQYSNYTSKVLYLGLIANSAFLVGNYMIVDGNIPFLPKLTLQAKKHDLRLWVLFCLLAFLLFIINIDITAFLTGTDYIGSGAVDREIKKSVYYEQLLEVGIIVLFSIYIKTQAYNKIKSFREYILGFPKLFLVVLCLYLILRLMSGDRGPVIYNIFILFYSYVMITKKKFKFLKVVSSLLVVALGITLLGFVRSLEDGDTFLERVYTSYSKMQADEKRTRSVSPVSQELAKSIACNFVAIHDIDKNVTDFKYGEYNIYNLIGSIPGSRFLLSDIIGVNLREKSSAEYLTISYSGRDYSYGLGSSAVAEAYLDFGVLGTFILFVIFGALYKKIDLNILAFRNTSIIQNIIILRFASYAIYTPRYTFAGTLSKALYIMIIYLLVTFIIRVLSKRKILKYNL